MYYLKIAKPCPEWHSKYLEHSAALEPFFAATHKEPSDRRALFQALESLIHAAHPPIAQGLCKWARNMHPGPLIEPQLAATEVQVAFVWFYRTLRSRMDDWAGQHTQEAFYRLERLYMDYVAHFANPYAIAHFFSRRVRVKHARVARFVAQACTVTRDEARVITRVTVHEPSPEVAGKLRQWQKSLVVAKATVAKMIHRRGLPAAWFDGTEVYAPLLEDEGPRQLVQAWFRIEVFLQRMARIDLNLSPSARVSNALARALGCPFPVENRSDYARVLFTMATRQRAPKRPCAALRRLQDHNGLGLKECAMRRRPKRLRASIVEE